MLTPEGQTLLNAIMTAFPPALLRELPGLIRAWEGCPPAVPIRQSIRKAIGSSASTALRPIFQVVPGRNHLITVSHPEAVRKFLLDAYEEFAGQYRDPDGRRAQVFHALRQP